MKRALHTVTWIWIAVAAQSWTVGRACAQPPEPGAASEAPPEAAAGSDNAPQPSGQEALRAALRERIARRIRELEREQRGLEVALNDIDERRSLTEIRRKNPSVRRLIEQAERERRLNAAADGGGRGPNDGGRRRPGGPTAPGDGLAAFDRAQLMNGVLHTIDELDALVHVPPFEAGTGRSDEPVSESDRLTIHTFLQAASPELDKQLRELHERDDSAAAERYKRIRPRMARAIELKQNDPELFAMVVEGAALRRQTAETARWLIRHEGDPSKADEAAPKRRELKVLAERVLNLVDRAGQRLAQRRATMREELVERLVGLMIERERFHMERAQDGRGPESRDDTGPGPEHRPDGDRRPGRPRSERPPQGRPDPR